MPRRNLFSRPSFELAANLDAWTSAAGTDALQRYGNGTVPSGAACAGTRRTSAAGRLWIATNATGAAAVVAGTTYAFRISAMRSTAGLLRGDVDWYNSAGTYLSTSEVSGNVAANTWTDLPVIATAPAGAVTARAWVEANPADGTSPTGVDLFVDAAQIEVGTAVGPYRDGSSAGWAWDGEPHASSSTKVDSANPRRALEAYGAAGTTSGPRTMGVEFWITSEAWVPIVWGFRTSTSVALPTSASVYRVSDGAEVSTVGTYSGPSTAVGWLPFFLARPFKPAINTRYRGAVLFPGTTVPGQSNYFTSGAGSAGHTNAPLVIPSAAQSTGGTQGWFVNGSARAFPSSGSSVGANYGVDVSVFVPDETPDGAPPRTMLIAQGVEGDTATPLYRSRRRTIGQALDTASAPAVVRYRRRDVATALEADTAPLVSPRRPGEARLARETDVALPIGQARARRVEQALEADAAAPIRRVRTRVLGVALDTSSATALTRAHRRNVGQAAEADAALAVGRRHARLLGQALEADSSFGIVHRARRRNVAQVVEADSSLTIRRGHRRDLGQAVTFEVARQLEQSAGSVSEEAYSKAWAAPDRTVYGTLRVDWRGDAFASPEGALSDNVSSLEIERSLDGDLPEGAGLVDGFATATLKATLGGRRKGQRMPLAAELSPFRTDSPLAGVRKSMRTAEAEIGVVTEDGPRATRLFTGPTRLIGIDEGSGVVDLTADDPSERMRALVTLPTYGEFVTHANRRAWKLTTNSQAVVDLCARRNGIFASPPPRPEAIIVSTGHGCLWAERGFNGAPISIYGSGPAAGLWTEDGHPYGMLGTPESSSYGTVGYQEFYGITDGVATPVRFQAGNGVGASLLLHAGSYMKGGTSVENRVLQVRVTEREYPRLFLNVRGDGALYAGLTPAAGQIYATPWVPTGSSKWRFVGVHFRWASNTSLVVTFRFDEQTRTYTLTVPAVTVTPGPFFGGYRPILQVNAGLSRGWSNLQVWPSATAPPAGPWQGETHVSQADIGRGNNELVYLPDVAAEESWSVLKAVTEAEYAVHGFTEFGRYYWRPRTDVRAETIDHVLDVERNLAEVGYSYGSDTIRNSVGVTTSASYHSGSLKTVVKAEDTDQFVIPAGATKVFRMDWPHGAAGYQGGILQYHYQEKADTAARDRAAGFPMWSGDVAHGWTYSSRGASGNWTILDNDRSVVIRYVQTDARKVEIRVSNPGPGPIRLATAATLDNPESGEPAMRIGGWPLEKAVDRVSVWRNEASIAELGGRDGGGERSYPIPSNEWRQDDAPLAPVARDLLAVLDRENAILEDLPCRGDARIRAGNVARGRFRDGGEAIGMITRARHVLDADDGSYRTLVSLRPLPIALVSEPTAAPEGWTFYVDISHHQGNRADPIDLGRVRDNGYAGCVARIGQGAGQYTKSGVTTTHGALIDTWWTRFRDVGVGLWPGTFAGYWYVGNVESPADQAARCAAAIGDSAIPVMLDWEDGAGSWSNLLAVRDAFVSAGLTVTMLYTNMQAYAGPNGASNIDATGLALINSRYWLNSATNPAQDPGAVWADVQATNPTFGFATAYGGTVDALQFTDAGTVYPGMNIDVNAFPGTPAQLGAMFRGEPIPTG